MRAVVQRVKKCSVSVDGNVVGNIDSGLLVYLGVERGDGDTDMNYMVDKIINLRIFTDDNGKMNLSVLDVGGSILVVSQFTLLGDVRRGRRPSYTSAAEPENAKEYFERFVEEIRKRGINVDKGIFAAKMYVSYTNVGPVTILIDSRKKF